MTSSFRQRTAAGNEAKKLSDLATQLDARRKSEVTDWRQAASDWSAISKDQHKHLTWKDEIELKQLADLSDAFMKFLTGPAVNITKKVWDEKIAKGKVDFKVAKAREEQKKAPDPNNTYTQAVNATNEAETKLQEVSVEGTKLAESHPNPAERHRLKQRFGFTAHGYKLAELEEKKNNYGNHVLDRLANDKTVINITYENDKGVEISEDIAINSPNKSREQYEAVRSHISGEYIRGIQGSFSNSYIIAKVIPEIDRVDTQQKKIWYETKRVAEQNDRIEGGRKKLWIATNDYLNNGVSVEKTAKAFVASHTTLRGDLKGVKGGQNVAWLGQVEQAFQNLAQEGATPDQLIALAKAIEIPHPAGKGGKGNLLEVAPQRFNVEDLTVMAEKAAITRVQNRQAAAQAFGEENFTELSTSEEFLFPAVPLDEAGHDLVQAQMIRDFETNNKAMEPAKLTELTNKLREIANRESLSPSDTNLKLTAAMQTNNEGKKIITRKTLAALQQKYNLDSRTVEEFEEQGLFGQEDEVFTYGIDANTIKEYTKNNGTLSSILVSLDTTLSDANTKNTFAYGQTLSLLNKDWMSRAIEIYDNGQAGISKEKALSDAAIQLDQEVRRVNEDNDITSPYYYKSGEGFINQQNQITASDRILIQRDNVRDYAIQDINRNGRDGFLDRKNPYVLDSQLEVNSSSNFKPNKVLYDIAHAAGPGVDPWHVLHAYRNQRDMPIEDIHQPPAHVLAVRKAVETSGPEAKVILHQLQRNPNSIVLNARVFSHLNVDRLGVVNALGEVNMNELSIGQKFEGQFELNPDTGFDADFEHPDANKDFTQARIAAANETGDESILPLSDVASQTKNTMDIKPGAGRDWLMQNGSKYGWYPMHTYTDRRGVQIQTKFVYKPKLSSYFQPGRGPLFFNHLLNR